MSAKKITALNATIEKLRSDMESDKTEHTTLIATLRGDLKTAQDEVLSLVKLGRDQQRHFDVEQAAWREPQLLGVQGCGRSQHESPPGLGAQS